MKILLLNPPNIEEVPLDAQTIPLGLVYIKEFMISNGYDIDILNLYFETNWSDVKNILSKQKYDVIGIPCYTQQRFSVYKLAKICKSINSNSNIILGGPHATYLDIDILIKFDFIDYIIRGEGECTFLELIRCLENDYDLHDVSGLTFRGHHGIPERNVNRKLLDNLDILPMPKYSYKEISDFPKCKSLMFHYLKISDMIDEHIAPALSSRGCNYSCIFCCNGAYWDKQRYHSPTYVFEMIKKTYYDFGVKMFDFYDDDFTGSRTHVIELCDLLINSDVNIHWWCSSRADGINSTMLRKMKKAGCFMISYGMESGSQIVLDNIKKNIKVGDIIDTSILTKKEGLFLRLTVSIGNPGENDKSIKETINVIHRLRPNQLGIFLVKMYPGTHLYNRGIMEGIIDNEYWFDKMNSSVPFYNSDNSMKSLMEYRNMITQSLRDYITNEYESKSYNLELDLEW